MNIKQIATGGSISGALLLALNAGLNALAFIVLIFSSMLFVKAFWETEKEIVVLNMVYLGINIFGLIRAI